MNYNQSNLRVIDAMKDLGIECEVKLLDHQTRTSAEAARALGCSIGQIAKSLIFKTASERAILAVTSGSNRVVLDKLAQIVGESVGKADADFVRSQTGFVIGAVAPVGLANPIETVFDRDLMEHATVWAAGGTANSLFEISNADLRRLATGRLFDFAEPLQ